MTETKDIYASDQIYYPNPNPAFDRFVSHINVLRARDLNLKYLLRASNLNLEHLLRASNWI